MRKYLLFGFFFIAACALYGLNRGIFIGTKLYEWGPAPCCPYMGADIVKKCRYLFVTGVAETTAHDGLTLGTKPPYSGYCTLFLK